MTTRKRAERRQVKRLVRPFCIQCANMGWFMYDGKPERCTCPLGRSNPDWRMAAEMKRKHDEREDMEGRLCNPVI